MDYEKRDQQLVEELQSLPLDYWDFEEEDTREYTHGIHSYPAVMVCPISRNIIRIVNKYMPIDALLDPFVGSGTVLVEGMIAGIREVAGNDINPLALFLTRAKTTHIDASKLLEESSKLLKRINDEYEKNKDFYSLADDTMISENGLDLTAKDGWGSNGYDYLKQYCEENGKKLEIPNFKNIGYWFKPNVILSLQLIKEQISTIKNIEIRNYFFVAFSEIIRLVSNRRNGEFKMFRMKPEKVAIFKPNVIEEYFKVLNRNIIKMEDFNVICKEKESESQVKLVMDNAMELQDLEDNKYDLIITSPPYGDSRTTVAYGEYSRLSLQWLGLDEMTEKEIMGLDKSLMGGKKYKEGFENTICSETLKKSLEKIKSVDLSRAGDVFSFYEDLDKTLDAISKKTKKGGYQFWVVGNRTVKNELLKTDEIIAELADKHNLKYVYTIGRNIVNKVMPSVNSPTNETGKTSSTMTNEHIVVLRRT